MKKFLAAALVIILCLSAFLFVGCNTPSSAPYIGENGNWWVGETDLGVKAQGQDGAPGKDGKDGKDGKNGEDGETPYIGENGNWWIGETDLGVKAKGQDGASGKDGKDGQNGTPGKDGAAGKDGENGKNGSDGKNGKDGKDGEDGRGIEKVELINGELIITFTDGTTHNAGRIEVGDTDNTDDTDAFDFYPLPDGTYAISGGRAKYLEAIVIPSSYKGKPVTMIAGNAFSEFEMKTVVIPSSVTSIGSSAFRGCRGLTSITIPDSVTSIGYMAFSGCSAMKELHISSVEAWCKVSLDDYSHPFFSSTATERNIYINGEKITDLVIPDSVTSIVSSAFRGCRGLTSITIPDSVTSIGASAFHGCRDLTSVTIGNGVEIIGYEAFYGCTGLTSVTIGNGVKSIGESAFSNCSGLTSVTIGNSVTSIVERAFSGCSGLTSIVIPDSVTSIGHDAFDGCSGLKTVYYGGTESDWNNNISINLGNTALYNATRYYYSESAPTTSGNYWHYVNGVPTKW